MMIIASTRFASRYLVAVAPLRWTTATLLSVIFFSSFSIHGQQTAPKNDKSEKAKAEQPLELPEFVITGVESLDVPGGAKQSPKLPSKLTSSELQRFNPLDKLSFTLLPSAALPNLLLPAQEKVGFLKGEFGMFISPSIDAGYRAVLENFDLTAQAGASLSNGHLDNADFTDLYARINSSYLAPQKFVFFGGGRTNSFFHARHRAYKFFGATDTTQLPSARTTLDLSAGVHTFGSVDSWVYDMGISADVMPVTTDDNALTNALVQGHIVGKKAMEEWFLGGSLDAALQHIDASLTDVYMFTPSGLVEFRDKRQMAHFLIRGGVQIARDYSMLTAGQPQRDVSLRPTISLNADVHLGEGISFYAEAFSGYMMNSIAALVRENPYTVLFRLPQEITMLTNTLYNVKFYARIQATREMSISLGGSSEARDSALVFGASAARGGIHTRADNIQIHQVFAEASLASDTINAFSARINLNIGSSQTFGNVPYLPLMEAAVEYRRYWLPALSTTLVGVYRGERDNGGRNAEQRTLPAFVDIRCGIEYALTSQLSIFARGTNLLNQSVFIWDNYQERGIFLAVGAFLRF